MPDDAELDPSELGNKEYWDGIYQREKNNFDEDGDEGEVWFGESSRDKMVQWALSNVPPSASSLPSILEVGTGNGNLLFALASAGYPPSRLAGIDYAPDAVRLACSIASSRGEQFKEIVFAEADFLDERERRTGMPRVAGMRAGEGWDVVMDKGTYDAIALSEKAGEDGARVYRKYPLRIAEILKPGGYFLITSCNFNKEELFQAFATPETSLEYHSEIEHKKLTFGGVTGSEYCTIAFRKQSNDLVKS